MYYNEEEIVSTHDTTITLKGGEEKELTPNELALLVTEEPLKWDDFQERKYIAVMTLMSECYDTLNLTYADLAEWIRRFDASFTKQRNIAIVNALGIEVKEWQDPTDISLVTHKIIQKHLTR